MNLNETFPGEEWKSKAVWFSNHTAFRPMSIALCGTHGSRVIAVTAYLFLFPCGANQKQELHYSALLTTASAKGGRQ